MKKFKFTINGNQYDVEIGTVEDNVAQVSVNGTIYEVQIDRSIQQQKTPKLVRSAEVHSAESAKAKTNSPDAPKGGGTVKSPLPGTILELHVKAGDQVKMGQKILTLEAMKMENVLYADREGSIQSIQCSKGDAVKEGDILMIIGD
jgi:glutaconyl-CoA/methylmalonyl-CoA decarboxylase subunit gamma